MDDEQLKCALLGIITYTFLSEAEGPIDYNVGDIMEIGAELDTPIVEATMELLASMDMNVLELIEMDIEEEDE